MQIKRQTYVYRLLIVLAVGLVWACGVSGALAQNAPSYAGQPVLRNITVSGTQRVEPQTVLSYMSLKPGDVFDVSQLNLSVKRLYATGLFSDISVNRYGDELQIVVQENPVINQIVFEGNNRLDDETLKAEVQLRERMVYTRSRVQADTNRLEQVYRRSGRFGAQVTPKIIERPQNRVDLVFEIDEGAKTEIARINFIGNKHFTDGTLRSVVLTKETAWYRFLSNNDTYDPDRLTFDRELLRQFYLKNGYADFQVVSGVAELSPNGQEFFITFTVEEGEQYTVRNVKVNSNIPDLDLTEVQKGFDIEVGEVYDASTVERTVELLTDKAGTLGYAFVDVGADANRDAANRMIDLTFNVNEGPKVYVERININGNVRTLDRVIRREFRLVEGDAFNTAKLRRSRQRIQNLGYFESVEVDTRQGSSPDKVVIDVAVTEQSTGEISFGAGYSTTESILGDIRLRERNFLGKGQDVNISLQLSGRRTEFDVSFTEPYMFGHDISGGIDLFRTTREVDEDGTFDEQRTGFVLRTGYNVNEHLRNSFNYTWKTVNIENVDADASRLIRDQQGEVTTSSIGMDIFYDHRDSRIEPTSGYYLKWGNDLAGFGGDTRFLRSEASGGLYYTVAEEWILSFTGQAGYVFGFGGEDVRISDRFFPGGDTMRGFDLGGMGPHDITTDDPLGANFYSVVSTELTFPLGLPSEFDISGHLFTDLGTAFGVDDVGPEIADEESLRWTVGVGFSWKSPFGPIRIDLSEAVLKEDFDQTEVFRLNFGTRF